MKKKLIAIVGPTASGKSDLGVNLALCFNGEIISADSRQIYKGLDVGSAKITKKEMKKIPHHMIDVVNPKNDFSLFNYLVEARPKINEIINRKHIPFLVGGTGLYVTSIIKGYNPPQVGPNPELRKKLDKLDILALQKYYKKIDPVGFKKIDTNNPRRLIRAIEVVKETGKPFFNQIKNFNTEFSTLTLGIDVPMESLKEKIEKRTAKRLLKIIIEIRNLHKKGITYKKLQNFGLEYKWITLLVRNKITKQDAIKNLNADIFSYAKRQMTWWKKQDVIWIKDFNEAKKEVVKFLKSDLNNE